MPGIVKKSGTGLLVVMFSAVVMSSSLPVQADTTVFDGPGFKVEKKNGWFGRKSTVYHDAFGNRIERKTGLFGRKSSETSLFGSKAVKKGKNVTVTGPNGEKLITKKRKLFGGTETRVDGNSILESVKDAFNSP